MPEIFHYLLTKLLDGLLMPIASYPLLALVLFSVLMGVLVAKLMTLLVAQRSVEGIGQQIRAEILAMRLFSDQSLNFIFCFLQIMFLIVLRLFFFLPALLILIPSGFMVANQVAIRFENRPLQPGETAMFSVSLKRNSGLDLYEPNLICDSPLTVVNGPFHDESLQEIHWEVAVSDRFPSENEPGTANLYLLIHGESVPFPVHLESPENPLPTVKGSWSSSFLSRSFFGSPLVWRSELPLRQVSLRYPEREYHWAGMHFSCWTAFLLFFFVSYGITRSLSK